MSVRCDLHSLSRTGSETYLFPKVLSYSSLELILFQGSGLFFLSQQASVLNKVRCMMHYPASVPPIPVNAKGVEARMLVGLIKELMEHGCRKGLGLAFPYNFKTPNISSGIGPNMTFILSLWSQLLDWRDINETF